MTPSKGTDRRTFRIHPDLWEAVTAAAAKRDETVSDVVRRALEKYVQETNERGRRSRRPTPPDSTLRDATAGHCCTHQEHDGTGLIHPGAN